MATLKVKHQQVCDRILSGQSEGDAYQAVYGGSNYGAAQASCQKMLKRPEVTEYMDTARGKVTEAVIESSIKSATALVRDLEIIVDADPRELMEYRRGCCRFCWGRENRYQRTPEELRQLMKAHNLANEARAKAKLPPEPLDEEGGIGYNRTKEANPDCPECFGEGHGYTLFKDTRGISPAAAKLFAGVKEKQNGMEIVTVSIERARETLMRHHGLLDTTKGKGEGGAGDTPPGGIPAAPEYAIKPDEEVPDAPIL